MVFMVKIDPKAFVTNETLDEAVDTILKGMDNLIVGLKTEVKSGFNQVNIHLDKVDAEMSYIKDDVKGLTADISNTPSRNEFNQLKGKVEKYLAS